MKSTKYLHYVFGAILLLGSVQQSLAADVEGRVVLRGKEIILYDDGTWSYDAEAVKVAAKIGVECFRSQIIDTLKMCYDGAKYQPAGIDGWEFSISNKKSTFYAGWIAEGTAIQLDALGKIVIEKAASATTGGRDGMAVRRNEPIEILGLQMRVLEFYADIRGVPVTFLNYHGPIEGRGTVQLLFFTTGDSLEPYREEIAELLASAQIG